MKRLCAFVFAIVAYVVLFGDAKATDVRIPLVYESDGTTIVPAVVTISLVDANKNPGVKFAAGSQLITDEQHDLDTSDLVIDLIPQSDISTVDGTATHYRIRTDVRGALYSQYDVQVPDSVVEQDLETLAGAAAIDPEDITAGRFVPAGGLTNEILTKTSDDDYDVDWSTASSGEQEIHASEHEIGGDDLIHHDSLTGFVANEHIDWTSDQGATNIPNENLDVTAIGGLSL